MQFQVGAVTAAEAVSKASTMAFDRTDKSISVPPFAHRSFPPDGRTTMAGSAKQLGLTNTFSEAAKAGQGPFDPNNARSMAEASAAAWRKILKVANADPKGWTRAMEVKISHVNMSCSHLKNFFRTNETYSHTHTHTPSISRCPA